MLEILVDILHYTFTIRNAMDGGNPIHAELDFRAIVGIMEGWMSNLRDRKSVV